jgi:hypothetical protein
MRDSYSRLLSMIMQWARAPAELERILHMDWNEFFGWYEEHIDDLVDADKAWHAIHAVLTDSSWDKQHDFSRPFSAGRSSEKTRDMANRGT